MYINKRPDIKLFSSPNANIFYARVCKLQKSYTFEFRPKEGLKLSVFSSQSAKLS